MRILQKKMFILLVNFKANMYKNKSSMYFKIYDCSNQKNVNKIRLKNIQKMSFGISRNRAKIIISSCDHDIGKKEGGIFCFIK